MTRSVKAPRLRRGDVVGIVSPSWGGAELFPHRVRSGIEQLEGLGFRVRIGEHALHRRGFVSDTARNRAQDIHDLFQDSEVRLILAAVGGDHCCHLLPELDFELIRRHPTAFMGFSDVTVLNLAIWHETGLVTFNGPALITDFAEYPEMLPYTRDAFLRAVCAPTPIGTLTPSEWWTEEFLDWERKEDQERPRRSERATGWTWLRGGSAEGVLLGGCLESLQHLRGTRYWPSWEGALLFLETSEEVPSPAKVDGILMDYENMGVLADIRGLLLGRPLGYSDRDRETLREVVLDRTALFDFPIVMDMDFGHTAPQFTLPIGCRARIDSRSQRFVVLEPSVT